MIDATREHLITLDNAAALLLVHRRTVYRWATVGVKGVMLDALPCGRNLRTSSEAVSRFTAALSGLRDHSPEDCRPVAPRRSKSHEAAARELAEVHGVY